MSADLDLTLGAIAKHGWTALLLQPRKKAPVASFDGHHVKTRNLSVLRGHKGNLGLYSHNVAMLDFDIEPARLDMIDVLGPLPATVETGSGKIHTYIPGDPNLPAQMRWKGVVIGQLRRVATEYVACPPSIHPDTGKAYRWLVDPREPLQPLPDTWAYHFATQPASDGASTSKGGAAFEIPEGPIQAGERHRVMFRWVRSWKASGYTFRDTKELLDEVNQKMCEPPIPQRDFDPWFRRSWELEDRSGFNDRAVTRTGLPTLRGIRGL